MSDVNVYLRENQECNENYSNNISSTENKSISTSTSSDLRNKINSNRSQSKHNSDEQWNNFKIARDCQSEESNEVERRNLKIKEVFSSDDIELYKEYVQWDFINNKLYKKGESLLNIVNEEKQIFRNTLKSWFNIINKKFQEIPKYEYYTILPKITLEHAAAEILLKQLIENKFVIETEANKKIEELLKFVSTNHSRVVPHNEAEPLLVEYDSDRNIMIVDKFKSEEVPRDNLISDKSGIIYAARLMLRRESFGNFHSEVLASPSEMNKLESRNCSSNKEEKINELDKEPERTMPRNDKIVNKGPQQPARESIELESSNCFSNKEEKIKVTLSIPKGSERKRLRVSSPDNELYKEPERKRQRISSRDIDLYKEYVQWDFINNKLYKKGEYLLNARGGKQKREFTNTLQRWLIFINEDFNDVPKYEYFSILPDIQLKHPAAQFLRTAIIEKKFATERDADSKVKEILSFISRNHSKVLDDPPDQLDVEHNETRNIVVVNNFQSKEGSRVNLLVRKGGVIATARVLLRYESLGNGGYQWRDPDEVYKVLHDKFDVRYEGFASPVNSRFIEYDETHFCSLFPETDAAFGSIGNFFDVDMEKHSGGWKVNPPFLNDLMKNVAIRIIEVLDAGHKCYFFCTFPNWEDDEGWNILNNSRYMLKRFNLPPHHFSVQDAYGRKFEPYMSMNVFVMGELPPNVDEKARLKELKKILIHNPK